DSLTLGTLSGTVEARNHDLQTLTDSIDRFVFAFTAEVNRVHAAGVGADGQGGRNLFVTSPSEGGAALALQLDPALVDNPERVAASQDARLVPGDNRNAVELSTLRQAVLTTGETAEASLQTVITDFADVVASVSGRLQVQTAIQDNFEQMQAGLSGVNIDEEMTLLLQYRQSYSAAAQVVRTADELMREVVALKR
ncbi:MAG: flagellar basal body rod C-terminal domain-containing protein, partial [Pseudomonadota bacterium]